MEKHAGDGCSVDVFNALNCTVVVKSTSNSKPPGPEGWKNVRIHTCLLVILGKEKQRPSLGYFRRQPSLHRRVPWKKPLIACPSF